MGAFEHDGLIYEICEAGLATGRILSSCGNHWLQPESMMATA
jgi:hypothetical protein